MVEILAVYYTFIFIYVGILCPLVVFFNGDKVYKMEEILSSKKHFIRCIFMYQFAIYDFFSDYINKVGITILEILTTVSVWFLNIIIFTLLCVSMILKWLCIGFYKVFKNNKK